MHWIFWILIVLAVLAAIWLGGSLVVYHMAFYYAPKVQRDVYECPEGEQYEAVHERMNAAIKRLDDRPYERVYITSHDGLRLSGRYYHFSDDAPLDIGFHGYKGNPLRDFSGGAHISNQLGHNCLLVEQRAHCESEGHEISFGMKERFDCLDWVKYAQERFGKNKKILLYGVSMGASTVLMASELELPEQVAVIIADCPYTTPKEIIIEVSRGMKIPDFVAAFFAESASRLFLGASLDTADAERAVKNSKKPILILHGEDDRFVPCEMGIRIAKANPQKCTIATFPDAGHGLSYLQDPKRYFKTVTEFIAQHTGATINI